MAVLVISDETLLQLKELAFKENVPVSGLAEKIIRQYAAEAAQRPPENDSPEMRKYDRAETDWDDKLHFQFAGDVSKAKIPGKLKNISMNGISFSFDPQHHIPEGIFLGYQTLLVSFEIPNTIHSVKLQMTPRYIHKDGASNLVGATFLEDGCDYNDLIAFMQLVENQTAAGG